MEGVDPQGTGDTVGHVVCWLLVVGCVGFYCRDSSVRVSVASKKKSHVIGRFLRNHAASLSGLN